MGGFRSQGVTDKDQLEGTREGAGGSCKFLQLFRPAAWTAARAGGGDQ